MVARVSDVAAQGRRLIPSAAAPAGHFAPVNRAGQGIARPPRAWPRRRRMRRGSAISRPDREAASMGQREGFPPCARSPSPAHRGRPDPNPGPVPHVGDPGIHVKTAPGQAQALDVGLRIHHLCAAIDQHAPPGPGLLVIVVGLGGGEILPLGRGQLRPGRSAEDHVLAIHEVVHRQDHRPPPADTDREARRRSG